MTAPVERVEPGLAPVASPHCGQRITRRMAGAPRVSLICTVPPGHPPSIKHTPHDTRGRNVLTHPDYQAERGKTDRRRAVAKTVPVPERVEEKEA